MLEAQPSIELWVVGMSQASNLGTHWNASPCNIGFDMGSLFIVFFLPCIGFFVLVSRNRIIGSSSHGYFILGMV